MSGCTSLTFARPTLTPAPPNVDFGRPHANNVCGVSDNTARSLICLSPAAVDLVGTQTNGRSAYPADGLLARNSSARGLEAAKDDLWYPFCLFQKTLWPRSAILTRLACARDVLLSIISPDTQCRRCHAVYSACRKSCITHVEPARALVSLTLYLKSRSFSCVMQRGKLELACDEQHRTRLSQLAASMSRHVGSKVQAFDAHNEREQ